MRKIITKRGGGKTTQAINISHRENKTIVCISVGECERVKSLALDKNMSIPEPMTYHEFLDNGMQQKEVIIDNVDIFLEGLTGHKIDTITLTKD